MGWNDRIDMDDLVGEILTHVDESHDQIMLTTESGRKIMIYHDQNCCERVGIEDIEGNWHDLIGKVIIGASHDEINQGDPPPEYPDSWTRTNLTFKVDGATLISRWIGESNGYYSESVDIEEITKGQK